MEPLAVTLVRRHRRALDRLPASRGLRPRRRHAHAVRPPATTRERRVMLNTIGPVWDGNEVWLITAGAGTFAAFPLWYASLFSALYLPLTIVLSASSSAPSRSSTAARCTRSAGDVAVDALHRPRLAHRGLRRRRPARPHDASACRSTRTATASAGRSSGSPATPCSAASRSSASASCTPPPSWRSRPTARCASARLCSRCAGRRCACCPLPPGRSAVQLEHGGNPVSWTAIVLAVAAGAFGLVQARAATRASPSPATPASACSAAPRSSRVFPEVLPSTIDPAFDLTLRTRPAALHARRDDVGGRSGCRSSSPTRHGATGSSGLSSGHTSRRTACAGGPSVMLDRCSTPPPRILYPLGVLTALKAAALVGLAEALSRGIVSVIAGPTPSGG